MSDPQPQSAAPSPPSPSFQFSLRTLLLLFVLLASSLAVFGAWGIVVFALSLSLAAYFRNMKPLTPLALSLIVLLAVTCLCIVLTPPVARPRESTARMRCMDNLKQIVVALQSYHASHGCFPPAYLADKNGKPMHSWRTLILPYMDCAGLYQLYDFTEPWDGPKNRKLLAFRPACYACPRDPPANTSRAQQTNYFAVVGPNSAWAGDRPRKAGDFLGKDSDTIMVVEVANSGVGWSEPRDCSCDSLRAPSEASGALDLSSNHGSRTDFFYTYNRNPEVNVAFADGHVFCLQYDGITPANLRKMLQIGGCTEEIMDAWNDIFVSEPQLNWPNIAALAVWLLSVGTLLTCAVRSRKPVSVPPTVPGVMGAKTD